MMVKENKGDGVDNDEGATEITPMLQELNPYELSEFKFLTSPPTHRRQTLENYIIVVGSHELVRAYEHPEKELKTHLNGFLPSYTSRDTVRKQFIRGISPVKILQGVEIQWAEESGVINSLIEKDYMADLKSKVSLLHSIATDVGIIDMSKVQKVMGEIPVEGGIVRGGYTQRR